MIKQAKVKVTDVVCRELLIRVLFEMIRWWTNWMDSAHTDCFFSPCLCWSYTSWSYNITKVYCFKNIVAHAKYTIQASVTDTLKKTPKNWVYLHKSCLARVNRCRCFSFVVSLISPADSAPAQKLLIISTLCTSRHMSETTKSNSNRRVLHEHAHLFESELRQGWLLFWIKWKWM